MNKIKSLLDGNRGALAKVITALENEEDPLLVSEIEKYCGNAYIIGITGPPGVGKSTFINSFITERLSKAEKIGVVAVDPSSPFTGGAILGDRIRMNSHSLNQRVFMRSMGSRGSLGGLALKTGLAVRAMDAFGMDEVIIETVGVGQSEIEIASAADTVIVVLAPGFGDDIQAMKAGILEIADIFIVNKSDNPMASKLANDLEQLSMMAQGAWQIPVVMCSSINKEGFDKAAEAVDRHRDFMMSTGEMDRRRLKRCETEIYTTAGDIAKKMVACGIESAGGLEKFAAQMKQENSSVLNLVERLLENEFINQRNKR